MELTRKELLAGAAAAGVLAGCGGGTQTPRVRHFDSFLLASHPRPVRAAIERHRRGLDADPAGYLREHEHALDARVAEAAGRYLGLDPASFAFTDSTTMGLGLVYGGLEMRGGEAVATWHDHYATHEALRLRFGRFRKIRLYEDPARATPDAIVDAVVRGVDDRTSVLALTWVHSSTGVKLPLARIAQALDGRRRQGLMIVVDGVHGLGADEEPISIASLDVLVAGCHKWLGGPRGTGLIWTQKGWDRMRPAIPSFALEPYIAWMEHRPPSLDAPPGPSFTPGGYHSFEHRWALAEAFEHQARLGRARVAARIRALATRLKEGLGDLPRVRLVTPLSPAVSAGIVCFDVDGLDPREAVDRLRAEHRIAASVTPYAETHVRLGTTADLDEADVDAALAAVARL